jgi:hypothetical protein
MRTWICLAVLGLGLLTAGCGDQPAAPNQPQLTATSPENAGEVLNRTAERYTLSDDGAAIAPDYQSPGAPSVSLTDPAYDVFSVTFVWGGLNNAPSGVRPLDWSGSLSVNGEAIIDVVYRIAFEEGDIVLPDSAPAYVGWISQTAGDFDGLSFLVFLRKDVIYCVEPQLTFDTPPFSISLSFGQLVKYAASFPVDSANGVAIFARKIWCNVCPGGLIEGAWVKDSTSGGFGTISAVWKDHAGTPVGLMTAMFWTSSDGTREFSGAVSGYFTDNIIAWVKGTWGYDDYRMCPLCGEGHGWFRGTYENIIDGTTGHLKGVFGDYSLPVTQRELPLVGYWQQDCPVVNAEPDVAIE